MGYLGSKGGSGVFQAVIAAMPPHDVYIETHLGSGVVMRAKPPAARSIGVDIDRAAIDLFWRALICELGPDAIQRVETTCDDAVDFFARFDFAAAGRVVVYADPPYVLSSRTAAAKHHYGPFDYTDDDHRRLIACLRQLPCAVMISGYPSALYDELLGDWRVIRFQAMTRGGPRTEELRLNFPAGEVQWARFAGANFGERQRIKRKAARWARMYAALPAGERLAVLAALLEGAAAAETPATMGYSGAPEGQTPATMVDAENPARDPA